MTDDSEMVRMRVGELLLNEGLVGPDLLARALTEQRTKKLRLCSLLVAIEEISFDDASRALGTHFGAAAVMQRHLEGRDRELTNLLPADLARSLVVLPIGAMRDGKLIVAVRDPNPTLATMLAAALRREVVLAVLPASHLERAIEVAYPAAGVDDDFSIDIDEPAAAAPARAAQAKSRSLPVEIRALPRAATGPMRDSLDATIGAYRDIDDREWLFDVTMQYLATQWTACILLSLRDTRAVGIRGHGKRLKPAVVRSLVLDIEEVAVLRIARDEKRIIDVAPDDLGSDHAELAAVMESLSFPIAAPIVTGDRVAHVLVLGDPLTADREDALVDLGLLIESMGDALSRM